MKKSAVFLSLVFLFAFQSATAHAQAANPPASVGQAQPQQTSPREYLQSAESAHPDWPHESVRAKNGMVVSDEKLASDAGVEIMKQGGNAVDAAVAVAFALAVVEPEAGNIGGGGFMLVRLANGRTGFVDYREVAPDKSSREMYRKPDGTDDLDASITGYRAVGVPGTVAGLALALHEYGSMQLSQVMAPAIHLAEVGFPVDARLGATLRASSRTLEQFPESKRIFLKDGAPYQQGEILKQPELAATLRLIAAKGAREFYHGKIAHELAAEMQKNGGLISLDDLAHYKPEIRMPLRKTYRVEGHSWEIITSPPPSSGGVVTLEVMNMLENGQPSSWSDPNSVALTLEAMRRAFADRALYLADPDFTKIPVAALTSGCYADALRATIDPAHPSASDKVAAEDPGLLKKAESEPCGSTSEKLPDADPQLAKALALEEARHGGHTTHFSVVDAAGNAVANTYTLNDSFGSGVTSSGGFLLNDEMDDFTAHPGKPNMFGLMQSEANTIAPHKRPLSSMMPTIVLRDGQLSFVTGSPGGPQIISATLLTILNWINLGMDAQAAINAPRFHHQWMPDLVFTEPTFPMGELQELQKRGYHMARPHWIGQVEAIGIDPQTGERLGAPDPRRGGAASSY
ncbi:MAG TPA: gamma-glutamyltransferase [Candidatus Acidoferrales bacterium]|nr:gamma-glutamyltransferase [Candidatus Acidoferrales bacterium]